MRVREPFTMLVAFCLGACSAGESGQVATAEEDVPASGGAVTLAATPPMGFNTWKIGLDSGPATVRNLWTHEDSQHLDDGTYATRLRRPVPGHGVVMLRVTPTGG